MPAKIPTALIFMYPYNVQCNFSMSKILLKNEFMTLSLFFFFFTISEASHFSYPGNIIGIFPLQISQSTVSDIPDNWLQVKRLLLSTKKWANETDKMPIGVRVGARKLNTNTTNFSF